MKKILSVFLVFITVVMLSACSRTTLYILNWGEYLDPDLIHTFEKEHSVRIREHSVVSNELMYTELKSGKTKFDIAVPSDYLIEKLYEEDLLLELNLDLLPNYKLERFDQNLEALRENFFEGNQKYNVPYFFGSVGIMYSLKNPKVEGLVKEYNWEVFFNRPLIGDAVKVGMYDSSRDAVAVAAMYLGYDINTTKQEELDKIEAVLKKMNYDMYGTDDLKRKIVEEYLDIALVYSGDFFDALYGSLDNDEPVNYNIHIPNTNNVWFDSLVIPRTSQNVELAHEFINFILEEENSLANAKYVGYCPTITSVYEKIKLDEEYKDLIAEYPTYYPIPPSPDFKGDVYRNLPPKDYQKIEELFIRTKSKK